ncbi:HTTM domain-containing protein [Bremerella cremea]|uniref:HTTM domain-containing protein n=1 Tax=Bremerella cremea TaxID=1031537 RepID=UPI001314B05D|nr:HTTM domain-containing protein [Bremerella cremea]
MLGTYFTRLSDSISDAWNSFWFQKESPRTVSILRIVAGIVALIYAFSFTSELAIWFSDGGVLPYARTLRLTGADDPTNRIYYWSVFYFAHSQLYLYLLHATGLISILMFTVGFQTRIAAIVATVFVISYAQRAPMLTGLVEPLLCPVMLYLCLAPCGAYFSVDAWLRDRRRTVPVPDSFLAHLAVRLVQVHVSMFYLMLAFAKLGNNVWWNGQAMWWLIAQPDTRLVDLTFLRANGLPTLVFAWTHLVVLFELVFGLFIWVRILRPLLAIVATIHWIALGLVTGHWVFAILMIGLSLAFAPLEVLTAKSETSSPANNKATQTPEPVGSGV